MMKLMMITMRSRGIGTSFVFSLSLLCRVSFNFSCALLNFSSALLYSFFAFSYSFVFSQSPLCMVLAFLRC